MKELFKLSIILALICCGAALALGSVYELTKEPIARQQQLKKQRAVAAVFPESAARQRYWKVLPRRLCDDDSPDSCRQFFRSSDGRRARQRHCSGSESLPAMAGPSTVMVGILPDGTLSAITIISHSETPGLGANITKESFCGQFSQLAVAESGLDLKKNGGSIDQVTGATISSAAVLQAVREQVRFFNDNRSKIISAQTEACTEPPCPSAKN